MVGADGQLKPISRVLFFIVFIVGMCEFHVYFVNFLILSIDPCSSLFNYGTVCCKLTVNIKMMQ